MLPLRIGYGLRDGFVASAEDELIGRRTGSHQINCGWVAVLRPDDDIVVVGRPNCKVSDRREATWGPRLRGIDPANELISSSKGSAAYDDLTTP